MAIVFVDVKLMAADSWAEHKVTIGLYDPRNDVGILNDEQLLIKVDEADICFGKRGREGTAAELRPGQSRFQLTSPATRCPEQLID